MSTWDSNNLGPSVFGRTSDFDRIPTLPHPGQISDSGIHHLTTDIGVSDRIFDPLPDLQPTYSRPDLGSRSPDRTSDPGVSERTQDPDILDETLAPDVFDRIYDPDTRDRVMTSVDTTRTWDPDDLLPLYP